VVSNCYNVDQTAGKSKKENFAHESWHMPSEFTKILAL